MKLGEAILERDLLEERLQLLESRLAHDTEQGRPLAHLQEELQRTANQVRDLEIAVSWTEQQVTLGGLPLAAYRIKSKTLKRVARAIEDSNRERADDLLELANADNKVLQAAIWLIDLQVPKVEIGQPTNKEE